MIKSKRYRYYGENGVIESVVLLPDAKHFLCWYLQASDGMILTNGNIYTYAIVVSESEIDQWVEVEDKGQLK